MTEVRSPWLTPSGVADYAHRSLTKVTEWIATGRLESHTDGSRGTLVHADDVDALIRSWPSAAKSPASP